jgi:glycosyltransferase involved in cell wall biosynthesis
MAILENLKHAVQRKTEVNHITGHVNYLALVTGRKTILTIHDIGSSFYGGKLHQIFMKLFWYYLPCLLVKKITVISEFSKEELIKLVPFAKEKIKVISNPVNSSLEYKPREFNKVKPLILHIGTKSNKNLERTIEALEGISCKFLIIGELSEKQQELLKKYKIDYTNKKYIPFSEIKAAYEECDLVSFVSLYEGFGMPVIEAQAVGRPVLTSAIEPINEVAGEAACFVDPENVEEIKQGFLKIIEDDEFRRQLIVRGQENEKRFQVEEIANQFLELYKEVASA